MHIKSTSDRYGAVAVAIHWISALAIAGLLVSGFRIASLADPLAKADLLRVHAAIGIAVLVLTLARLSWWLFADRKPAGVPGTPPLQERAAKAVHGLFYVVILGMGASGIGMLVLSGAGAILYLGAPGLMPDFTVFAPRVPHGLGAFALLALIVLHVGAALYHQFVRRDRLIARMGF